jgi:hypothetical protein
MDNDEGNRLIGTLRPLLNDLQSMFFVGNPLGVHIAYIENEVKA